MQHSYLFSTYQDGDPYYWLENLACYSPIIHLQQTDGNVSEHWPFNKKYNAVGIIEGDKVLKAIYDSYGRSQTGMPAACQNIYLTIEVFAGTLEIPYDILKNIEDSVQYWRNIIPEDGLTVGKLV